MFTLPEILDTRFHSNKSKLFSERLVPYQFKIFSSYFMSEMQH
jgi:hypothetical protein